MIDKVVLVGLSGTGKSTIGRAVADVLGWSLIDTDDEIQATAEKSIPDIFVEVGEPGFRALERIELLRVLDLSQVVIATGGGAVVAEDAWSEKVLRRLGVLTIALDASAEIVHARLAEASSKYGDAARRPLLDASNPLAAIRAMKSARSSAYARADVILPVGDRTIEAIVADIVELVGLQNGEMSTVRVSLPTIESHVVVGNRSRHLLAEILRSEWSTAQQIWLAADANVEIHAAEIRQELETSGYFTNLTFIPPGESQKSLDGLSALYDWMLGNGVQRGDVMVALGGGKVGDLVGFAAATVLRGIGLVQVPTTLLSMVDSSIGGKTAINHRAGKNLIGAFYQPSRVLIDPELLASVPPRELASGWAEIIKHGEIQHSTPNGTSGRLKEILHLNHAQLTALNEPILSWVIRQNLSIKAAVVMADEKESGLRGILNYGHTIGHAIESSGYRYLHGEAIAVGLVAAIKLAVSLGRIPGIEVDRIEQTVRHYGLPIRAEAAVDDVIARIASDKKKSAGKQQWILANAAGRVTIETNVPDSVIIQVAQDVLDAPSDPIEELQNMRGE